MSTIHPELSYDRDISQVVGIQFTLQSPEEIIANSVAEIESSDTFTGNEPVIGGIFDSRMGVIEPGKKCRTCAQTYTFCPGHFGHITMARPVFYYQFFDTVRDILKCVCINCSKLLVPTSKLIDEHIITKKLSNQKRFDQIKKFIVKSNINECPHCNATVPTKVIKDMDHLTISIVFGEAKTKDGKENKDLITRYLYADEVLPILKGISNEDSEILGFSEKYNRPEWMICSVFPVPPPSMRPSVRYDTGQRSEDDLTHQLINIIKKNNVLKQKLERIQEGSVIASVDEINKKTQDLQYYIFTFVDNNIQNLMSVKQRMGNRSLKTLIERLKGKEGRFRINLMGKRVDFSARSVITPDPNIGIDELGVPYKIAMNLTVPEIVNRYNIEELSEYVRNGPHIYPGAKYVKDSEKNITLIIREKNQKKLNIKYGDIVYRHMKNGDTVLFNRQPSLHKMSMMAHKARIMDYDTFRLNVCVCPCYNADFDG
jgi:DNA-directed RNA polymerase beta' subunit